MLDTTSQQVNQMVGPTVPCRSISDPNGPTWALWGDWSKAHNIPETNLSQSTYPRMWKVKVIGGM